MVTWVNNQYEDLALLTNLNRQLRHIPVFGSMGSMQVQLAI
jgi:hypothetical protein